jgi:hypothetical protein
LEQTKLQVKQLSDGYFGVFQDDVLLSEWKTEERAIAHIDPFQPGSTATVSTSYNNAQDYTPDNRSYEGMRYIGVDPRGLPD